MKKNILRYCTTLAAALIPGLLRAQQELHPSQVQSELTEPVALFMVIIALLLLAVIAVLSRGIIIGTDIYRKNRQKSATLLLLALLSAPMMLYAQEADPEAAAAVVSTTIGGISKSTFYFLSGIIILEILIILILLGVFYTLLGKRKITAEAAATKRKIHWIERFNAAPAAKGITDAELSMGHNFDGIEELDNPSPPWWRWGFALSLVFSVVYLWVYELSGTGRNQYEELAYHTAEAEAAVKEYLAKSANNVDENTVTYLNNEADLTAGKAIFVQVCAACHAPDGGGNEVGPNLTDDYWLHGGTIQNIFKTIKYGVIEKGMRSWQDDYSPRQIAQLASYIKSLKGTTPAKPKAPQGDLFKEDATSGEQEATAEQQQPADGHTAALH